MVDVYLDEEMDAPVPCQHCGKWFDLSDGYGSEKWYPNIVICETCHNEEEKEIERDEDIRDLMETISDAEYTLKESKIELAKLTNEKQIFDTVYIKAKLLLVLENKQDWINNIPIKLPVKNRYKEQFLWVDKNGCVFEVGSDFDAAERLATFPCSIYRTIPVSHFEKMKGDDYAAS